MDTPPVENSIEFGQRVRRMRTLVGKSLDEIAGLGGPSRSLQSRLENGEPIPFTADTADKYVVAFTAANRAFLPAEPHSFLRALAVVSRAISVNSGHQQRHDLIAAALIHGNPQELILGATVEPDSQVITATSLRKSLSTAELANGVLRQMLATSEAEFLEILFLIALRHPTITYVHSASPIVDAARQAAAQAARSVLENIENHIDPIASITSLDAAQHRAAAFGADDAKVVNGVAWAILFSNILAAKEKTSALEAWNTHQRNTEAWHEVYRRAQASIKKALPSQESIREAAHPYLNSWTAIDPTEPPAVSFSISADGQEQWTVSDDWKLQPATDVDPGDLWVYGGRLDRDRQGALVGRVLADIGIPNLHLTNTGVGLSRPPAFRGYQWCPAGSSAYALVRTEPEPWQAIQVH